MLIIDEYYFFGFETSQSAHFHPASHHDVRFSKERKLMARSYQRGSHKEEGVKKLDREQTPI
jgi:hypothetical protein